MKVNLLTELTDLDGTPLLGDNKGKAMTVCSTFCSALLLQQQGEIIEGIEKARRYNFSIILHNAEQIELNVDQAKLLQDLVAIAYPPLIVGQIWNILNPPPDSLPEAVEAKEEVVDGVPVGDGEML